MVSRCSPSANKPVIILEDPGAGTTWDVKYEAEGQFLAKSPCDKPGFLVERTWIARAAVHEAVGLAQESEIGRQISPV